MGSPRPSVAADCFEHRIVPRALVSGAMVRARRGRGDARVVGLATAYPRACRSASSLAPQWLALAERFSRGLVHINDQTLDGKSNAPFCGPGGSSTDAHHGNLAANSTRSPRSRGSRCVKACRGTRSETGPLLGWQFALHPPGAQITGVSALGSHVVARQPSIQPLS